MPASEGRRRRPRRTSSTYGPAVSTRKQTPQQAQQPPQAQQQPQQAQQPQAQQRERQRRASRSPSTAASDDSLTKPFSLACFGRHSSYGNGLRRPLMRGWLHTAVFVVGLTVVRAACTRTCDLVADCRPHFLGCDASIPGDGGLNSTHHLLIAALAAKLRKQNAPGLLFSQWCLLGYAGSVNFHMVPYRTNRSFNLALAGDLVGVALGSLAPLMVWGSSVAPPVESPWPLLDSMLGVNPVELAGAIAVLLTLCIAAMLCSTLWRGKNVLDEFRWQRLGAQGSILLLQTFAEFWSCWSVSELHLILIVVLALKVAAPVYFLVFGTAFAEGKHEYAKRVLTVDGVWEHHENFHVVAGVAHASQLWLVLAALDAAARAQMETNEP